MALIYPAQVNFRVKVHGLYPNNAQTLHAGQFPSKLDTLRVSFTRFSAHHLRTNLQALKVHKIRAEIDLAYDGRLAIATQYGLDGNNSESISPILKTMNKFRVSLWKISLNIAIQKRYTT